MKPKTVHVLLVLSEETLEMELEEKILGDLDMELEEEVQDE